MTPKEKKGEKIKALFYNHTGRRLPTVFDESDAKIVRIIVESFDPAIDLCFEITYNPKILSLKNDSDDD